MINKIFNWTIGSFFRTLGRILVYLFIAFLISMIISKSNIKLPSLFSVLDVYAYETWPDSQNISITVNGANLTTTSKLYRASGTHTFKISSDQLYIPAYSDENVFKYNYGYISTCVSSSFAVGTYSSGYFSKNMRVYMTSVPCQIYNTTAYPNSVVMYITFELNQGPSTGTRTMCTIGSSSTLCTLDNSFDISVPKNVEYTLNSYGFSLQPFIFDDTTSSLINQNQVIINQNNQIINKLDSQSQQQHQDSLNEQQKLDDIKNNMNNSNTNSAKNDANNFFSNFTTNTHGLTGIITAPLNAIRSLTSSTCSDLVLPLPFVNQNLTLPCMRPIYEQHFGSFMNLYDIITLGIVSYWVMVRIFGLVKDFKNPEHDEIEVVDL